MRSAAADVHDVLHGSHREILFCANYLNRFPPGIEVSREIKRPASTKMRMAVWFGTQVLCVPCRWKVNSARHIDVAPFRLRQLANSGERSCTLLNVASPSFSGDVDDCASSSHSSAVGAF